MPRRERNRKCLRLLPPLRTRGSLGIFRQEVLQVFRRRQKARIVLNRGIREIMAQEGDTLADVLAGNDVHLSRGCGGHGSCGTCLCRMDPPPGPAGALELPWLGEERTREGWRLACQTVLSGDCGVEVPGQALEAVKISCRVVSVSKPGRGLAELVLAPRESGMPSWQAGQYALLEPAMPFPRRKTGPRAFSIASPPGQENTLRFLVGLVPGGAVSTFVHRHLRPGMKVECTLPLGENTFRPCGGTVLLVAGGTGIAPLRAMADFLCENRNGTTPRNVVLWHGARSRDELVWEEHFRTMARKHEGLRYLPALSGPAGDGWDGLQGRIPALLDSWLARTPLPPDSRAWVCGSAGMVEACRNILQKRGLSDDRVHRESF